MAKKYFTFLIAAVFCFGFFANPVFAEEEDSSITSSQEIVLQLSTLPEAKIGFTQKFKFPVLQGESPLTSGNNVNLALTAEIAPISFNAIATAVLTPIAFLEFTAGGRIGTGWNMELFGGEIFGIGLNTADISGNAVHDGSGFDGMLWETRIGGAFQFDFAALFPGDWNHVIVRTYHEFNYRGYTRAEKGQSWYFENDDGENVNGFNYYGNYLIGYQMPIFLNMIALLAEAELYLYDTPNRSLWGDDRIRWTFGGILNFAVFKQFSATVITQFRTVRNYTDANWEDLYYRNRNIDASKPLSLEFYRVAAVLTYKL